MFRSFDFQILERGAQRIIRPPDDGVSNDGLHLEAQLQAAYDVRGRKLTDAAPRKPTQEMPVFDLSFHYSLFLVKSEVVIVDLSVRGDLIRDNITHGTQPERHLDLFRIDRKETYIRGFLA